MTGPFTCTRRSMAGRSYLMRPPVEATSIDRFAAKATRSRGGTVALREGRRG